MDSPALHDQFVEQFVRSQGRIYAFVATLLPNRADAEEVFQQTSLILWKKWEQFDEGRDFVRWACGIAHHEAANFLRKQAKKGRVYLSEEIMAEVAQVRLGIDEELEARRRALQYCLQRLKHGKRELLERCYAGGESIKVIAEAIGKQPNMVYMILKRLRRVLFDCVNRTLAAEGVR